MTDELNLKILHCESLFSWFLPDIEPKKLDRFLVHQLEKCNINDTSECKWTSFCVRLVLAFELWDKKGDIVCAKHQVELCCQELRALAELWSDNRLLGPIHCALWHVTLATKARLLLESRYTEDASKAVEEVRPVSQWSTAETAALSGIQAAVYSLYGRKGLTQALELATAARDLDPNQAEWHFLVAYCLAKTRTEEGPVTLKEIEELEHASSLENNATYCVYLAQAYTDTSNYLHHNRTKTSVCHSPKVGLEQSTTNAKNAVSKFKEGLQLRPNCLWVMGRVAHGLLCIPDRTITDWALAKTLLDQVVDITPNKSNIHLDIGKFYDKFGGDPVKAVEHLTTAHNLRNYQAFLYMVSLKWKYCMDNALIHELREALDKYNEDTQRAELLVYLGAVYLLQQDDWTNAVQCFIKSLDFDPTASSMEQFCGFYWKNKTANLLEIVTNELRIKTKEKFAQINIFHQFLEKIITINQKLFKQRTDPTLYTKFKTLQNRSKYGVERVSLLYK